MAEAAGHPYSRLTACYGFGLLNLRRGDLDRAIPVLEQGLEVCNAWGLHALSFHGVASFLGAAYVLAGRVAEALPLLEQVVQQTDAMGIVFDHVLGVIPLGEGYLRAGRIEDALHQAQHAVEVCRQHQQRGHEAWALRLLGEVVAQRHPPEVEQPKLTTARPSLWPKNSACAHSRRTATWVSVPYTPRRDGGNRLTPSCLLLSSYIVPWT